MNISLDDVVLLNDEGKKEDFRITVTKESCFVRIRAIYCGEKETTLSVAKIASIKHCMPGDVAIYGEGYSKLSQTIGTLSNPQNVTKYSDAGHYKLPIKENYYTAYNMLLISKEPYILIAHTSTDRFVGKIHFNKDEILLEQDLGNILIQPQEEIILEEIMIDTNNDRNILLGKLGERLGHNHKRMHIESIPTGWCSWYCYGPEVTQKDVYDNIQGIKERIPELRYIQIDDGYQAYMGDYLSFGKGFSGFEGLIQDIKKQGFEPAIWVAPFIAEEESRLLQEHPEYFVQGEDGKPLASDKVSFGGWRSGPWYMLDGTHPEAREHLKKVFKTMREEWGIHYFKLDANMWGALPFGKHYDPTKTYVEAYRMGMKAILEGAGEGCYVLGCNAPMWPSIGLVHGMRTTGDTSRKWSSFDKLAEECFYRNWQHNHLWINDPDCIVLDNKRGELIGPGGEIENYGSTLTEAEFSYHRAHILASGGAILSGDAIIELKQDRIEQLRKHLDLPDQAAQFDDDTFTIGRQTRGKEHIITVFNREETNKSIEVDLRGTYTVLDFWSEEVYGEKICKVCFNLDPHSAKAIKCILEDKSLI